MIYCFVKFGEYYIIYYITFFIKVLILDGLFGESRTDSFVSHLSLDGEVGETGTDTTLTYLQIGGEVGETNTDSTLDNRRDKAPIPGIIARS